MHFECIKEFSAEVRCKTKSNRHFTKDVSNPLLQTYTNSKYYVFRHCTCVKVLYPWSPNFVKFVRAVPGFIGELVNWQDLVNSTFSTCKGEQLYYISIVSYATWHKTVGTVKIVFGINLSLSLPVPPVGTILDYIH